MLRAGQPYETVKLSCLGRDVNVFRKLIEEARQAAIKKTEGKMIIYTSLGLEWKPFGLPRKRRPLHSVILDK